MKPNRPGMDMLLAAAIGQSLASGIPPELLPSLETTSTRKRKVLTHVADETKKEIEEWNARVEQKKALKKAKK